MWADKYNKSSYLYQGCALCFYDISVLAITFKEVLCRYSYSYRQENLRFKSVSKLFIVNEPS